MTDLAIESAMRAALLDSQRRILDRIASGAPLQETLGTLVGLIEEQANGMRCAVLLADSAQQSPRLPSSEHIELIDMAVQMARVAIDAKHSEDALRKSEDGLRVVIDTIPAMAWSVLPDGAVDFLNQRWLDYARPFFGTAS